MSKKIKLVRLWDLAKGAKIHGLGLEKDGKPIKGGVVVFDHVDGMYSYNTVEDAKGNQVKGDDGHVAVVHLANAAWLKQVDDHYVMATEDEVNKHAPKD